MVLLCKKKTVTNHLSEFDDDLKDSQIHEEEDNLISQENTLLLDDTDDLIQQDYIEFHQRRSSKFRGTTQSKLIDYSEPMDHMIEEVSEVESDFGGNSMIHHRNTLESMEDETPDFFKTRHNTDGFGVFSSIKNSTMNLEKSD